MLAWASFDSSKGPRTDNPCQCLLFHRNLPMAVEHEKKLESFLMFRE